MNCKKIPRSPQASVTKKKPYINKVLALVLYSVLGVILLAVFVMTVVASAGNGAVWRGIPMAVCMALLGIALSVAIVMFNPRSNFYSIGFYVSHIGIILFLIGFTYYTVSGVTHNVSPPNVGSITPTLEYRMTNQQGLTADDLADLKGYKNRVGNASTGEITDFGFNFRITDFVTEYYEDGQSVKHYEATMEFLNTDGTVETASLTVNHPIYRNGWKIYLMNVGTDPVYGYQTVHLMIKSDPTEFLSVAGIWLIILGTFVMCFIRPRDTVGRLSGIKPKWPQPKKGGNA